MDGGNRRLQYLIAVAVYTSAITTGVSYSWVTPVLLKFAKNEVGFQIDNSHISWITSILTIGYIAGSFVARFMEKYGGRTTIICSAVPCIIGTILKLCAFKWSMVCTARFLWGVGDGMICAVSTIYLAEISDKEIRGRITAAHRVMTGFGSLLVIIIGSFLNFQALNYVTLIFPALYVAASFWIPESPYYLVKLGKVEAARKTLRMITGIRDEDVLESKLADICTQVKIEMSRSGTLKELITGKRYRKAIVIVIVIYVSETVAGINAIQYYLGSILLESNTEINITTALIIYGAFRFVLGMISSLLIDRAGRRPLLVWSFFASSFLLGGVAVYYELQKYADISYSYPCTMIPFVAIILSVVASVLGYESVITVISAEIYPMNMKALAMFIVILCGSLANFTTIKTHQELKDAAGLFGVFLLHSLAALVGGLFSYFFVPETKGKSLKEIQKDLQGDLYEKDVDNLSDDHILVNNTRSDKEAKEELLLECTI